MRKKILCFFALIFFCIGFYPSILFSLDYTSSIRALSKKVHTYYPHVEGSIVAIKGADLYLSIGSRNKVVKGLKIGVFRQGEVFKHPVTGEPLGSLEKNVADIKVVEVREKFSVARVIRLAPGGDLVPKVKDVVRASSAKIKIAILPFANLTDEPYSTDLLTRELVKSLLKKGRFDVFDIDQLEVWLLKNGIPEDKILEGKNPISLRNEVRSDMAIQSAIVEVKGRTFLKSKVISLTSKRVLFEAIASVSRVPYAQGVPKKGTLKRGKRRRGFFAFGGNFQKSTSGLPGISIMGGVKAFHFDKLGVRGVAVSDLDLDGKNELVILTSTELIAFQILNNKIRELFRYDAGVGNDFRWMDVADLNSNGVPEIYVASYEHDNVSSLVFEVKQKKFVKIFSKRNIFLRVLKTRKKNPSSKDKDVSLLLGQRQGFDEPFTGPIARYTWSSDQIMKIATYKMPEDFEILGFSLWDIDRDGKLNIIEIGKDDKLRIMNRTGSVFYKSAEYYGAAVHRFQSTEERRNSTSVSEFDILIRSRIKVEDTDGDGIEEVLVIANKYSGSRIVPGLGISAGQIVSMVWDGSGLSEFWRSKKLSQGVVDFEVADSDNDGRKDLIVVTTDTSMLTTNPSSKIYLYDIKKYGK
ncbi:MAG: hypothetical protein VX794_00735 [Nitrospinota bacterium]|nr:hypothetical protein [Nitrospinota bacterium]